MISTSELPGTGSRAASVALVGSVVVHLLALTAALFANRQLDLVLLHVPPPPAASQFDEIVTISTARRFSRLATLEHQQVAYGPRDRTVRPENVPPPRFSRSEVSSAQRDFAKAIGRSLAAQPSLRVDPDPAAAPRRFRIQLQGVLGHLHHGEGIYYPTKGWRSGGLDYYFVAYEYTYPDGKLESGDVPWPIHFSPDADPFVSPDVTMLRHTPMPGPSPGFVPPGDLGKALRGYFPSLHFEDQDAQP